MNVASRVSVPACILIGAFLLPASAPHAATYIAGTGNGCTHATVQAAIDAAQTNPGPDTVRVTRTQAWNAQEVVINTNQELTVTGGFDACGTSAPSGMTTLSGAGGNARQVFRITLPTGGLVRLQHLMIRDADPASDADGGGILFSGNGRLELSDTSVIQNQAGYGAGIYAQGTDNDSRLVFGPNVIVAFNTARYSGGGVYVNNLREFYMDQPGSVIMWNTAQGNGGGGYGGGLMIRDSGRGTNAFIGSGQAGLGAIVSNTAVYGGGVAVYGDDPGSVTTSIVSYAALHLRQTTPDVAARIRDNVATQRGGALYLRSYADFDDAVDAEAYLWNVDVEANSARAGAAIFSESGDDGSTVAINSTAGFPDTPGTCPTGSFCGGIVDNIVQDANGSPTTGAVIQLGSGTDFRASTSSADGNPDNGPEVSGGLRIEGNRGGRLIQHDGGAMSIRNALIADNAVTDVLIRHGEGRQQLTDITLAGNVIGGSHVFVKGGGPAPGFVVRRTILWQPGKTLLQCNGCTREFEWVFANERASLDGGQTPYVAVRDPRFIDPARGDYRPRAASPAVDYVSPITGDDRDVLGMPRDQNLPIVVPGIRDIGAYERPTLLPLVLNGDYDVDWNLWPQTAAGVSSWDGTQNASGPSGSGAIKVTQAGTPNLQRVYGLNQCIHLPGPGVYALNGWGRAGAGGIGNRDYLYLNWELRHDGGEGCSSGPADASGDHFLSNSSNWQHPVNPKLIEISAGDWTSNSSLFITQVVTESGITNPPTTIGWFDGITLELEVDDTIFEDGFDPAL